MRGGAGRYQEILGDTWKVRGDTWEILSSLSSMLSSLFGGGIIADNW